MAISKSLDMIGAPVTNGPCFFMGRGLSSLRNISLLGGENKVALKGYLSDKTVVVADLDPTKGYLAKSITRYEKDGRTVFTKWILGKAAGDAISGFYASECTRILDTPAILDKYKVVYKSVSTAMPNEADLTCKWYLPQHTINDHRVSPTVGFSYRELARKLNGKTPTLAVLLTYSQQRAKVVQERLANDAARLQVKETSNIFVEIAAAAAIIVFAIATALLGSEKRRDKRRHVAYAIWRLLVRSGQQHKRIDVCLTCLGRLCPSRLPKFLLP